MNNQENLSHQELITKSLLETLEEQEANMNKDEKDGIIMLLIETSIEK